MWYFAEILMYPLHDYMCVSNKQSIPCCAVVVMHIKSQVTLCCKVIHIYTFGALVELQFLFKQKGSELGGIVLVKLQHSVQSPMRNSVVLCVMFFVLSV